MAEPTDREIGERWYATWRELDALKKKKDDASLRRKDEIKEEQRRLKWAWEDILVRRRKGHLTDSLRVDAMVKIVKENALMSGVSAKVEHRGGLPDGDHAPTFWLVMASSIGDVERDRWIKFTKKATEELMQFPFLLPWNGPVSLYPKEDQEPFDYEQDFSEPGPFMLMESGSDGLTSVWALNHWTWRGPYVKRSWLREQIEDFEKDCTAALSAGKESRE